MNALCCSVLKLQMKQNNISTYQHVECSQYLGDKSFTYLETETKESQCTGRSYEYNLLAT